MPASSHPLGRDREIAELEEAWERTVRGTAQLCVVAGRRRTGKTHLLSHLARGRRAVMFSASGQSEAVELQRLATAVAGSLGPEAAARFGDGLSGWEDALRRLMELAAEPLLVVIDEVPRLIQALPGLAASIQRVWDYRVGPSRLMLVLAGSGVAAMRSLFTTPSGGRSGGRLQVDLELRPFGPREARAFRPDLEPADFLRAYTICGGYPLHLLSWDPGATPRHNLIRLALTPGGLLVDGAPALLHQEVGEVQGQLRALAAVAGGATRYSEIRQLVDQRVDHALDLLVAGGLLARRVPLGEAETSRLVRYRVTDEHLLTWYQLVQPAWVAIHAGEGEETAARLETAWSERARQVLAGAARQHAERLAAQGQLPSDLVVGAWWGRGRASLPVEVMGMRHGRTALIGAAVWDNAPAGVDSVAPLHRLSATVPDPSERLSYAIWSPAGVEADLTRMGILGFSAADVLS
jgi:AAA+ ATPase superfamily predicted ATPase